MTTPTRPGRGPGPRQEPGPVGLLARLFLSQLLVVLAVAAVIASVFALAGSDGTTPDGAAAQPGTSSPAAGGSAAPAPSDAPPPPTESAPPATSSPPSTPAPTPAKQPKVDVLNQSAGGDAARVTADRLRSRGWRIGRVADFRGTVQTTTVYYPAGMRPDARRLAKDLPGSPRLLERFSSLSPNRLSVVLV